MLHSAVYLRRPRPILKDTPNPRVTQNVLANLNGSQKQIKVVNLEKSKQVEGEDLSRIDQKQERVGSR